MPIKPENRSRYPVNWKDIRVAILDRAGHRCAKCRAPNLATIARGAGHCAGTYMLDDATVYSAETGERLGQCRMSDFDLSHMVRVVLTIAHLDHTPENCDPANLRAWCQQCHLRYDHEYHIANARATRRSRLAARDLFEVAA